MFYTYLWLREDGTPYYVGKGSGKRAFVNLRHKVVRPPRDKKFILVQEFPSEADAFEAEKFLISYYGRKDLGLGCLRNLTDGGDGCTNMSPISRKKIGDAHRGKKISESHRASISGENNPRPMLGKHHSDDTKKKISESRKGKGGQSGSKNGMFGRKHSPTACEKMSITRKGQNTWSKGRKLSDETRRKMSEARKGDKNPNFGKKFSAETLRKMSDVQKARFANAAGTA
jgi:hypothetical protein